MNTVKIKTNNEIIDGIMFFDGRQCVIKFNSEKIRKKIEKESDGYVAILDSSDFYNLFVTKET